MADNILKHLYDVREAAGAIFRFVRDKTFDDYEQDELLRSGIERKFEIVGEALNRVKVVGGIWISIPKHIALPHRHPERQAIRSGQHT